MKLSEMKSRLRRVNRDFYPELAGLSPDEIYEGKMGPGGLYLAARMSRTLQLSAGDAVMDLGCGRGATSVFLAQRSGVRVVAIDLWVSANELHQRFVRKGVSQSVIPLNLDITQKLPFADSYFHAIFCMDSIHYYGGSIDFMRHLLKHLRPGGRFCIGSPCFNEEFSPEAIRRLPREYDDGTDLWRSEFSRYHSPQWWAELLDETGIVDIAECTELEDGVVMWEDELLYNIERCGWPEDRANTDFAQIAYGYAKRPYLTHFVLTVQKRKAQQGAAADADRPCC